MRNQRAGKGGCCEDDHNKTYRPDRPNKTYKPRNTGRPNRLCEVDAAKTGKNYWAYWAYPAYSAYRP